MDLSCDALLCDLDGVLADSRAAVERTWRRWAARHGVDAEALLRVAHGRRTRDTLREAAPQVNLAREVAWLDAAELEDLDGVVAVPGAVALVRALPDASWAIVTSCGRELARRRLGRAGVREPACVVTSEDVSRGKPFPDGYLLAARRLGRDPASCLVFEDAPAGLAAAAAAGCRAVAVATTHAREQLGGAVAIVADLGAVSVRRERGGLLVRIPEMPAAASGAARDGR